MTSRERVLATLDHREPDRVPLDLGGSFVTGIAATSLDRLRGRPGLEEGPVKVYDAYQMLGEVEMAAVKLKREYGDRLTFWGGGVETQSTLPFGTPAQVREEARERIRVFAPGGGLVFNPVHNIQPNTPPRSIQAAYEAAFEFGAYLISM